MRCACGQKNPPEARFCMACGQALEAPLPEERRHVSVVFFDLVASSERFREGLGPAYQGLREALEEAARVARAKGGFVHRFLGDGILVLFGAPRARGREPWRALEAALEMVAASPLPGRAGVASGLALWAPLGSGQAGEPTAVGPPVVLAERLSKLAAPGEVLADAATLALAPGAEAEPLSPLEVKGLGRVEAARVHGVRPEPGPGGRALLAQVRQALARPPGRLNLVGPPGSGKSFLLERLLEEPFPFPVVVLERMGPETPLRASLREAVERAFGTPEALLDRAGLPEGLALAWRYSLGLAQRPSWGREELEEAILEAWRRVLWRLPGPMLLVLKDLHLPDPTLARLLRHPFPRLLLVAESRKPLFAPTLALPGPQKPLLLALQPALDALPTRERQALLAWGVLGEVPEEVLEALAGRFSRERLEREGLLEGGKPLPEVAQAARLLVPEERAKAWHLAAADHLRQRGDLLRAARHLKEAGEARQAAQAYRLLAQRAWREGHPERALPLYQKALEADPSLRAFLERERQDALASLGLAEEAEGGPRSQDPVLAAFKEAQSPWALLPLLPGLKPYPLEEAQARLALAGAFWRAFKPRQALEVLKGFPEGAPPSLRLHGKSLQAGLLMDLGRYPEAEALLKPGEGDLEAQVRFHATRLRLLLETGRLEAALEEGEAAYRNVPHPWLAAALLTAWTLKGRFREDLLEAAKAHPDGRGLALLALAHHRWLRGENPKPFLKEALREARRLSNPYVHHLALTSLALYHWPRSPQKARVLSQHLLYQTHRTGFSVHLELARLLRAQLLLEEGERVDHLLGFTPSVSLTAAWKAALAGEGPWDLRGYGMLGRWVRQLWRRRRGAWTGRP
ncbi:Adenylate cyclase, class 3 [Thermus arciformis]|uniref:Adenylate cyclase, class 3 n=1 Tax=Thermus arciformis TaxID=482827 RepID=A0A1G7ECC7_9DEIN|nr:adenylate/guanylate cyclase domain-containing protein [Thermus arciformis]SDE61354.1 Adenylate cyclase, class 3 [Thermus arciformis]